MRILKCGTCGKENPDDAQFCQECGNSIGEKANMDHMVEKEVDRRLDEKEIKHILSQVKKLAIILGFIGIIILILGFLAAASAESLYFIIIGFLGVLYLILSIIIITQQTKSMILITRYNNSGPWIIHRLNPIINRNILIILLQ